MDGAAPSFLIRADRPYLSAIALGQALGGLQRLPYYTTQLGSYPYRISQLYK